MSQALFGLIGVVVGALLTWFREIWSTSLARKRNARYLAIRVVCILDQYVEDCTAVAFDDGLCQGQLDENGCLSAQAPTPPPPTYPQDLDWKSIDHPLMYRVLSLPRLAEAANRKISYVSDVSGPPYDEYFEERQQQYSALGLSAAELTREIRKRYDIPPQDLGDWNPADRLRGILKDIADHRHARVAQLASSPPLI